MTIRELAKSAGVSRTTVSRALNDSPGVSTLTKDRIVKLAAKLGYQANPMITALMSDVRRRRVQENKSVLAIVPPPFQKVIWGRGNIAHRLYRIGVERRAKQLGFKVEDFMFKDHGKSYRRLSQVLYQRGIQAVLVPSVDVKTHPSAYDYSLDWKLFYLAGIGFSVPRPLNLDRAAMSHFGSAALALSRIYNLGYRKIGFCSRSWITERTQGRWLGAFLLFQAEHPDLVKLPPFEFEFGENENQRLLEWFDANKPEVILGERYFLQLLKDCGYVIPRDVSFALLDVLPGGSDNEGIAGIDQRFESVGAATVDMLAGRINRNERGLSEEPHVLKVAGRWVDGPSLPKVE